MGELGLRALNLQGGLTAERIHELTFVEARVEVAVALVGWAKEHGSEDVLRLAMEIHPGSVHSPVKEEPL